MYTARFPRRCAAIMRRARRGLSLLELTVILVVLGVLTFAAISRFSGSTLGVIGAQGEARRVALDFFQARRRAISTGDNHFLRFDSSGGSIVSYTLVRRADGGDVVVDAVRMVPSHVTITSTHSECEFNFQGQALANYQVTVAGGDRSWTVSAIPVTGTIRAQEN